MHLDASPQKVREHREKRWANEWSSKCRTLKHPYICKVLLPMKPPKALENETIKPLLIFWAVLGPQDTPLSKVDDLTYDFPFNKPANWPNEIPNKFSELWVFSVSTYLRGIGADTLELPMPNAATRVRLLNHLVSL